MVADLEPQAMDLGDFLPVHEVAAVGHPTMGNKECGAKSQLLQKRGDKGPMRFDGIVERQNHNPIARFSLRVGWSVPVLGTHGVAGGEAQDEQETQEACVSGVAVNRYKH